MLFSSRNELFLGCFEYRGLDPWLGSWSCVDPKEAVLKQK